jgi:urease accessory protein UreH
MFPGDRLQTTVVAQPGARAIVRSVAATPLRRGPASASFVHLDARVDSTLLYLPGALVPHHGSHHTSVLRLRAEAGARLLAASVLVPGRTGSGERLAFDRLRLRTSASVGIQPLFEEDTLVEPHPSLDGPAGFAGAGAALTILALGDWPLTSPEWWLDLDLPLSMAGGASPLAPGLLAFRAICDTLGTAHLFLDHLRQRIEPCFLATESHP